jgi:hypothetical protein
VMTRLFELVAQPMGASNGCGRGQKVKKDERITPSTTKTI